MNEKLNDALNEISDKHLEEAVKPVKKRNIYWLGAIAAILVIAMLAGILSRISSLPDSTDPPILQDPTQPTNDSTEPTIPGDTEPTTPGTLSIGLLAAPIYPEMVKYSEENYREWSESQRAQYDQPKGYADSLDDFFDNSIRLFLQGEGNQAYSPVNVYMAMAMLAECADGTSRQQILDLLGANSIENLREQAGHVWNAHYSNDGLTTLLLANSLWLDEAYEFDQNTVQTLADNYYASSYQGNLATEEMNQQLRNWLNANTGELLKDQSQNIQLDPRAVAALASTIYFSAAWNDSFAESKTAQAVFHAPSGDKNVWFMNSILDEKLFFWGENYGALTLGMSGDNTMWLILPDMDTSASELLESGDFLTMLRNPGDWEGQGLYDVHLSMPKFDISDQTDLIDGMTKLGITEVFDPNSADLSGLITNTDAFVGQIDHAVRVTVDEEGCIAAAYTIITAPGAGPPQDLEEIYFTLDRPFLFVITSQDGLPLFAGTVNEP